MGTSTGAQLLARMLKAEGVRHIFTLSGLHIAPIYAACVEEGIAVIDTRHEQAAVHAADATARLTRGIGVAAVTAGPGVTDALTGVANAFAAASPVLLLGGAAPTFNAGKGSLQEMEQVDLFTRISKWSDRIPSPERVPTYMAKAFRTMLTGRPGPVFLEVPWDVLSNGVDDEEVRLPTGYRTQARQPGDPGYVDRAAALLSRAERPAVVAGSSIWWDDASTQLAAFAERLGAPVYLNGAGRGCLPADHPLFFSQTRKEALAEADLVLIAGTPLDFRLGYGAGIGESAKIVQIDSDPAEIGRNRAVDIGILGDSRSVLQQITAAISGKAQTAAWLRQLRERELAKAAKQATYEQSDQVPIHHFRLAKELDQVARVAGDSTFVADGGNWVAIAAKVIQLRRPGRWLDPGPLGCLGVGAPFAIAAKLLHPDRPVFVVQGDGSFGFNGMDYETALRFKLPMICVVGNDASWGQIRLPQLQFHGPEKSPATLLAPTRYDKVVEAFGGYGEHVTEPEQIRPALERAVASGTVACVNVMLDPEAPAASGAQGYAI
ncbi:MAG: thiamine pyrophosphate-binding protein [Deltaproteobacteria bacterium]|nr:MAG: thiamine pyrophosphate-binding protein [Deltaproteobacteria bacterium]